MIRVAIFAAVLTLLLLAQTPGWIAAIIAAVFGFAASYIFFGKLRTQVAQDLEDRRTGKTQPATDDEDAEDLDAPIGDQNFLEGDGQRKQ